MGSPKLSELLVSYRADSRYAPLCALVVALDRAMTAPSAAAAASSDDQEALSFEGLVEVAQALQRLPWRVPSSATSVAVAADATAPTLEALAPAAHRVLLRVATDHIPRAAPDTGLRFAEHALDIARAFELKEETRRGYNVCSALYTLSGAAADAVEYGLMAACVASELDYDAAVVNSLGNVIAALVTMGMHAEALDMAERVCGAYAENVACTLDLANVQSNAAKAALVLKRYAVAIGNAQHAIAAIEAAALTDVHETGNQLINELTWLQCAIATDDAATVTARMAAIDRLADRFTSTRNDLNRRFAAALHLGFVKKAYAATISELTALKSHTQPFSAFTIDVLAQLMTMASDAGDHSSALYFAGQLVETVGQARLAGVRARIAALGAIPKPHRLQPDSAQTVIDRIVALAATPNPAPVRVATLADPALMQALERLAATAELCDDPSRRALYRVGRLAGLLARELGYTEGQALALEHAARLHDIGKLGIPSAILAKPAVRLTESEYLTVWRHAAIGAQLLQQCDEPLFQLAASIAHAHHEAWDGTGYPRNLQGTEIPEAARIVCLAENYDSMTHARSYRHALTHPEAIAFISKNAGIQFDPVMTPVFIRMIERLRALHGARMNTWLAQDAPAQSDRLTDETMRLRLHDLVPDAVLAKLRGVLRDDAD